MKHLKKLSFGVLVAAFLLAVTPAFAQAPPFSAGGTATSTNAVVTYSPANPRYVELFNYGSARLTYSFNAVATAAFGANLINLEPCEKARVFMPAGGTTVGVITAASTTSTYKVNAYYNSISTSSGRLVGAPADESVDITVLPGCNASTLLTANGAQLVPFANSELITLATGAAVTDSTANLLPANSIIDSVVCRVTTTITTAVTWQISDPTTAGRFSATSATMTAGATIVGLAQMFGVVTTTAAGPTQAADAKLRLTMNANPGAGVVRCTVFGRTFVAPTS